MDFTRTHYYVRMTKYYGLCCVLLLPCIIVSSLCTYIVVTVTMHMYVVTVTMHMCVVTVTMHMYVVTITMHMYYCGCYYAHVLL